MTQSDYAAIEALDLEPIKVKLMHEESGEGWSLERANAVEKEYRRFLYLMKKYPEEQAAPLMDVDTFWHYHILDTMKYAADCDEVFGYFLHHFPYVGLRGEADEAAHHLMGERMKELYEETFGEDYIRAGATAWSARATESPAATAWSARAPAQAAWSARAPESVAVNTAWSGRAPQSLAGKTAWSARATTAWSASPARQASDSQQAPATAWSASPTRHASDSQQAPATAWSASPTRQALTNQQAPATAWSASPARQAADGAIATTVAWSASPARNAAPAASAAPKAAWSARSTVDQFYTQRPRLTQAAN
ncbi:glycine-rich domain-containing protein-like [Massilia sp. METH4]|uniref:glycine-rich domain-containing protein n=1 Tax=Massilia sp. METH4 TaxID=3123041 RepID=UPI0030D10438